MIGNGNKENVEESKGLEEWIGNMSFIVTTNKKLANKYLVPNEEVFIIFLYG